jgi:hypothetical protein
VEVVLWSIADVQSDVATGAPGSRLPREQIAMMDAALAPRALRASPAQLATWEASGLRVRQVRGSDAQVLAEQLSAQGGQKQSWVLFGNQPAEVVRGPRAGPSTMIATDAGPLDISSSPIVLSLRAWPLPALPPGVLAASANAPGDDAGSTKSASRFVQLELLLSVPQPQASTRGTIAAEAAESVRAGDVGSRSTLLAGLPALAGLLPRLTLSAVVQEGDSLLIESIPALPDDDAGKGPPTPPLPSLGEALLSDALAFPRSGVRVAVLVRPVLPPARE